MTELGICDLCVEEANIKEIEEEKATNDPRMNLQNSNKTKTFIDSLNQTINH